MQQRRVETPDPPDAFRNASAEASAPPKIEDLGLVIVHWGSEVGLVSETLAQPLCYLANATPPAALVSQAGRLLFLDELIEAVSAERQAWLERNGRCPAASLDGEREPPASGNWDAAADFLSRHLPQHRALLR